MKTISKSPNVSYLFSFLLIALISFFLFSCKEKPQINTDIEKQEVLQFLKDYAAFINKISVDYFESYWNESEFASYIPLERDSAIIGYKEIRDYFKKQFDEVQSIEFKIFNSMIWVTQTKSEAQVIFLSSKKIQFKNGFNLSFQQIRNSMLLTKFEGRWKIMSLHESVRQ